MKTLCTLVVVLAVLSATVQGGCDPWGARKCGIEFLACVTSGTVTKITPEERCPCYATERTCLTKYDCGNSVAIEAFNAICRSERCTPAQCGTA